MRTDQEAIDASAVALRQRLGNRAPRVAVLLGSGWARFADEVQDAVELPYADLPAFPQLAIAGHSGVVKVGRVGGVEVAVLAGRQHAYETGEADGMKGAIRTLAALGVQVLVQTNAAGSIDATMRPGELMLISDHLNIAQRSPLIDEPGDSRFIDMVAAYCPRLRAQAQAAAQAAGATLHEGVYAWVIGPQFETPAEIRMLRALGAQAVGMSTVPETILARHAGMRVLALSMLTNMAAGMEVETLSHAHTLATAGAAQRVGCAHLVRHRAGCRDLNAMDELEVTARQALACLDLTSLADGHDLAGGEADIEQLCLRAIGPAWRNGATAAVCVWPRQAALARSLLPAAIRVAAVANFPDGGSDIARAQRDTAQIVAAGAQEVDVVLPYRDLATAPALLAAVRRECAGLTLKVILETGEIADDLQIRQAARIALQAGADFLKTSTGKRPVAATPAAARLLLAAIADDPTASQRVGFKPAGGIRTVADAALYIAADGRAARCSGHRAGSFSHRCQRPARRHRSRVVRHRAPGSRQRLLSSNQRSPIPCATCIPSVSSRRPCSPAAPRPTPLSAPSR